MSPMYFLLWAILKHSEHGHAEIQKAPPAGFDQGGLGHQSAFDGFLHQVSCQVNCRQPLGAPDAGPGETKLILSGMPSVFVFIHIFKLNHDILEHNSHKTYFLNITMRHYHISIHLHIYIYIPVRSTLMILDRWITTISKHQRG